MKLLALRIERFGAWCGLDLPLTARAGPLVIHGPNEAGKTTLLEFLRFMLFGTPGRPIAPGGQTGQKIGGSLEFETEEGRFHLERLHDTATREEQVRLVGPSGELPPEDLSARLLANLSAATFNGVYAFGLDEMHALGALHGSELAGRLYEVSLGPEGKRLVEGLRRAREARRQLIDPAQHDGRLVRLFEERDQLLAELARAADAWRRHADLRAARHALEQQIDDLQSRRAGLTSQLRGHQLLQATWGPWSRVRACEAELRALPAVPAFPQRGLERLAQLELALGQALDKARRASQRFGRARQAARLPDDEARRRLAEPGMRGFVAQQDWLDEVQRQVARAARQADEAEYEFETRREALGNEWSAQRLSGLQAGAAAQDRVTSLVESFARARTRRARLARRYRRLRDLRAELAETLEAATRNSGGMSPQAAIHQASLRLRQAVEQTRESGRLSLLLERRTALCALHAAAARQLELPRWVYAVLSGFCFLGVILAGWGLLAGMTASALAGALYGLLGVSCVALAHGIRSQQQGEARERLQALRAELAAIERALQEPRAAAVDQGTPEAVPAAQHHANPELPDPAADPVTRAAAALAEMRDLARHERRLAQLDRRTRLCRRKLRRARTELATARAGLADELAGLGLPGLGADESCLSVLRPAWEAAARHAEWQRARQELSAWQQMQIAFSDRLARFGARMGLDLPPDLPAHRILANWQAQLELWEEDDRRRALALKTCRALRKSLRRRAAMIRHLRHRRAALLVQAGASTPEEFQERGRAMARRAYLEDQRAEAQRNLEQATMGYQDLAVVEEDLRAYDAARNAQCIATIEGELNDLQLDLRQACQELGGLNERLRLLEQDRRGTELRFRLALLEGRLQQAVRDWCAVEWAAAAVEEQCHEYAARHQPQALADASAYFEQLTGGRFSRVWTPLGQSALCIEDAAGGRVSLDALSRGTQEQLYLALRLALANCQRRQGVLLPVMMDDVLVNFDQQRAQAAVTLMCQLAAEGQQLVYFTCHQHLARLFENRGASALALHAAPDAAQGDQRRLAG